MPQSIQAQHGMALAAERLAKLDIHTGRCIL
jgi:hypothetical protein